MPTPYRARNKRLIHRSGVGTFKRSTLADIGMACCEGCGAIFTPQEPAPGGFIDPKVFRESRQFCVECAPKGGK